MGVKVYYSEISAHKEVKKRQQKVMMILESKAIPYEAIDITEAGRETDKDFMLTNAKPKGDCKYGLSPQVFNDETYCGDYDDFELANENDELEKFLNVEKVERRQSVLNAQQNQNGAVQNGTSRGSSAEKEAKQDKTATEVIPEVPVAPVTEEPVAESAPVEESNPEVADEEEPMSTSEPVPQPPPAEEETLDNVQPDPKVLEEHEEKA